MSQRYLVVSDLSSSYICSGMTTAASTGLVRLDSTQCLALCF